jgi:hypothetical protein
MLKRPNVPTPFLPAFIQNKRRAGVVGAPPPVYRPTPVKTGIQLKHASQRVIPGISPIFAPNVCHPSRRAIQPMSVKHADFTSVLAHDVITKRRNEGDMDFWANYASLCFLYNGANHYIIERNAGMNSTHAEIKCYRAMTEKIEELSGKKTSWNDSIANLRQKTGAGISIHWIYTEREPCPGCEKHIDQKAGHTSTLTYYNIKYRDVLQADSADNLRVALEAL